MNPPLMDMRRALKKEIQPSNFIYFDNVKVEEMTKGEMAELVAKRVGVA